MSRSRSLFRHIEALSRLAVVPDWAPVSLAPARMTSLGCLLLAWLANGCTVPATALVNGEVLSSNASSPGSLPSTGWASVTLPDRWNDTRPDYEGSVWYRFTIPSAEREEIERWAVYLPRLKMNAAVFVNEAWVGDGGSFKPPVAQHWNRPLYFELSRRLLRLDGTDVVHIRVFSYRNDWGGLSPFYLAPHEALAPHYQLQHFLQIDASRAVTLAILTLMLLVIGLSISERGRGYRWLLAACGFLAVHSLAAHIRDIGVPYWFGRWGIHASFDMFVFTLVGFAHRWSGRARPRLERVLFITLVAGLAASMLAPSLYFLAVSRWVHVFILGVGIHGLVVAVQTLRRSPRAEQVIGVVFGTIALGLGLLGLAPFFGVLPPESPRLIVLMGSALLFGVGGLVLVRYARALREAAKVNAELESRVKQREAELTRELDKAHRLRRARAIDKERERLMREVHDGMGGQIVSLLDLVERGEPDRSELQSALATTLDDMRMLIDALDPDVDDVPTLLGMMRVRLGRRIRVGGVTLRWGVTDLPKLPWLGRAELAHVQRIVQESITNALKHADAKEIALETAEEEHGGAEGVVIRIRDDGVGLPDEPTLGRGLRNLEHRAQAIGGHVRVQSAPDGGTEVRLWLPLDAPAQSRESKPS